jgi:hypothetical protein
MTTIESTNFEVEKLLSDFESIRLGCDTFLGKLDTWIASRKESMKESKDQHEIVLSANSGKLSN